MNQSSGSKSISSSQQGGNFWKLSTFILIFESKLFSDLKIYLYLFLDRRHSKLPYYVKFILNHWNSFRLILK